MDQKFEFYKTIDALYEMVKGLMVSCDQEISINSELQHLTVGELSDFGLDNISNGINEQVKA